MNDMKIAPSVAYIGTDDTELDLFEGQYAIPDGISYNSYVILDKKTVVMDTVDARCTREWLANLAEALDGRTPDYLVVSHMEPDHSSNVKRLMDMYPEMRVVCTAPAAKMLTRFFGESLDTSRVQAVKEGDTLEIGARTLQFFTAPMVHWPEVMMTYEPTAGTLFCADAFGKFGALSKTDPDDWTCEARRYYFNIVGKYGVQVQSVLRKLASLDIRTLCPLHGPVLSANIERYVGLYDTWSSYRAEDRGIFIAYCSLHGNTEEAALKLASLLKSDGAVTVATSDLRRDDMAEAIEDAFRYDRLVLAAPTYDGGVMPVMSDFLHHLKIKNYQRRRVAFIENGTWAPQAARLMRQAMEEMKDITVIEPVVTVESTMKPDTVEALKVLAAALQKDA